MPVHADIIEDPCDRCDGEGAECKGCKYVREYLQWLQENR